MKGVPASEAYCGLPHQSRDRGPPVAGVLSSAPFPSDGRAEHEQK